MYIDSSPKVLLMLILFVELLDFQACTFNFNDRD